MQRVFGVKLFKARYFEKRICLKSTQLKQNQYKVNSVKFVLNELVLCFVFKGISDRRGFPYWGNFILLENLCHVNSDFNGCSLFTESCF